MIWHCLFCVSFYYLWMLQAQCQTYAHTTCFQVFHPTSHRLIWGCTTLLESGTTEVWRPWAIFILQHPQFKMFLDRQASQGLHLLVGLGFTVIFEALLMTSDTGSSMEACSRIHTWWRERMKTSTIQVFLWMVAGPNKTCVIILNFLLWCSCPVGY